jgi:hypothetical protein
MKIEAYEIKIRTADLGQHPISILVSREFAYRLKREIDPADDIVITSPNNSSVVLKGVTDVTSGTRPSPEESVPKMWMTLWASRVCPAPAMWGCDDS